MYKSRENIRQFNNNNNNSKDSTLSFEDLDIDIDLDNNNFILINSRTIESTNLEGGE